MYHFPNNLIELNSIEIFFKFRSTEKKIQETKFYTK